MGGGFSAQNPKNIHTQFYMAVFKPLHADVPIWHCGTLELEKKNHLLWGMSIYVAKLPHAKTRKLSHIGAKICYCSRIYKP